MPLIAQHGVATSADGTRIAFRSIGIGPGLVIWHGSMQSAPSHLGLAELLARRHTVHLVDRRGRGASDEGEHSLEREVADVAAVLSATGSDGLLGVSSGAIVTLESALTVPEVRRAVVFEPPLVVGDSLSTDFIARYEREIAAGDVTGALVTGMLGAQMGPPIMQRMPRRLLRWMTGAMMKRQDRGASADVPTMRVLAPTLAADFGLVEEGRGRLDSYTRIDKPVLLLGGERSPRYLHLALDSLATAVPGASRVELPGVGHGVLGPADQGGKPSLAVPALVEFLSALT
jgi:pimeloyl-ACP methyl ester carboxylesterase